MSVEPQTYNPFDVTDEDENPAPVPVKEPVDTSDPGPDTPQGTRSPYPRPRLSSWRGLRRLLYGAGLLILLLTFKPWETLPIAGTIENPGTTGTVTSAAGTPGTVIGDITVAKTYLQENHTFEGLLLPGAQLAIKHDTVYIARAVDNVCMVYGFLNGDQLETIADTTGAACTGQIAVVQAQLDATEVQSVVSQEHDAREKLQTAARRAALYASRNFVKGAPSFTGLSEIPGVLIAQNAGTYVQLEIASPGICLSLMVTAVGEIGDIFPC